MKQATAKTPQKTYTTTEVTLLLGDVQTDVARAEVLDKTRQALKQGTLKADANLIEAIFAPTLRSVLGAAKDTLRTIGEIDPVLALNGWVGQALASSGDKSAQASFLQDAEELLKAKPELVTEDVVGKLRTIEMPALPRKGLGKGAGDAFRVVTLRSVPKSEEEQLQRALTSIRLTVDQLKIARVFPAAPKAKPAAEAKPAAPKPPTP